MSFCAPGGWLSTLSYEDKMNGYISFESPPEEILNKITKQFCSVVILGSLVETNVSENSSRRNAMDSASKMLKILRKTI